MKPTELHDKLSYPTHPLWNRELNPIHPNTVLSALAEVEGDPFERFFKEFGTAVFGLSFSPLGGRHDGGADGFEQRGLFESSRQLTYFQATTEESHRPKIKKTISRLKDYGREIGTLNYFTSRIIKDLDTEILELSNTYNTNINIYDAQWISNRINQSDTTRAAYENHLRFYASLSTEDRKNSSVRIPSEYNINAAAFISQNSLMSPSSHGVRGNVIDSLALFVLENAAIQGNPFKTSVEIFDGMKAAFPTGFSFTDDEVAQRLALMSTRSHPSGRQIVWDEREVGYALPFPSRENLQSQQSDFEALIYRVREEIRSDIIELYKPDEEETPIIGPLVDASMRTLEILFTDEGMKIAQFLDGAEEDIADSTVQDVAIRSLKDLGIAKRDAARHLSLVIEVMRRVFYKTSNYQKEYLSYLSRTYALLFSLKYDLKLSSYFDDMRSNFRLLVGADVIIQALSESRLLESDRATHNMLRALRTSGAELILTDYAVDEVYTHIVAANEEFLNHYIEQDKYITTEIAKHSDRILIRAYYYSKISPSSETMRVRNWPEFINQFLPHSEIRKAEARIALRTYLREKFNLRIESKLDLEEIINKDRHQKLARTLMNSGVKDRWELALNDAAHILLVYALRSEAQETARASPVGYRTWWLTSETRVQRAFENLIGQHGKAIMRPQIAAQLLSFAPNADEVRLAYGSIMPSLVGVRLGNRSHPSVLRAMLDKVAEVSGDDPARMKAEMERLANRLKSDENKQVESSIG